MSATIFSGAVIRALKAALRLNDQATIWSGSNDPTVTPTFGRQGDMYIKFGAAPAFYQKVTADGTDINWTRGAPIAPDAITGAEIRLDNDQFLRGRNAADTTDVNIVKVNASDRIEFGSVPQVTSDPSSGNDLVRDSNLTTRLALKINLTEKGAALGVATLDGGGKVPLSQLPSSVLTYEGTWNAATNTPTLADGIGDAGMVYITDTAGTVNFGSGPISFAVGDWVIYNGTIWQKSLNSNAVVSVNGFTGVVVLTTSDIAEGANLYFTDERAQDAVGSILTDTSTIDLSYNDAGNQITADVKNDSLTNVHINSAAAIAYSKLNLAASIVNADIAVGAAIAVAKLAALTANRAVVTDGSGVLSPSASTAAQVGYLADVTSLIQAQIDGKQPTGNYITSITGDGTASGPGAAAFTLATVNGNVGSFGAADTVGQFTVNGKGLVTAAAAVAIQITQSQVTGLVAALSGKQPTGNYITSLTGEATASGPGAAAVVLDNAAVIGKVLTGYVSGAGVVAASDSILQAIQKLNGNISGSSAAPQIFGSRASPNSIVAATGITSGAGFMSTSALNQDIYVAGSITGDSVAATISSGTVDGQRMTIIGRSETNTVTLTVATTNVDLNGPVTLGAGDVINLRWDTTNWHEVSRS